MILLAWAASAVAGRLDDPRGAQRWMARPCAVRVGVPHRRIGERVVARVRRDRARAMAPHRGARWTRRDPARAPGDGPDRAPVVRRVVVVDRRPAHPGHLRPARAPAHRDACARSRSKSDPVDLLRGLGNWYFYGFDRFGFSIDQAASYVDRTAVIAASFAVPVLALCAAGVVRWRHRGFFAALVVVGTVVGVGAWPYDDPSAYGSVFKWFANDTAAGLALRNTPRVVPVIVLGLAGLLAAGVGALAPRRRDWLAAAAVVILVALAFAPVWRYGYLSDGVRAPNDIPEYWKQAAAAMQADGNGTRVLEIPGSDFSAYRWGDTIEPVTPGLIDRPYVAREVLPSGTPPSVNLLVALDHRIQEGTLEPAALAAYARLINVGTISVRSDLAYERFGTPNPRVLWQQLTEPLAARPPRTARVRSRRSQPAATTAARTRRARAAHSGHGSEPAAGRALRGRRRRPDRACRAVRTTSGPRRRRRGNRRRNRRRAPRRQAARVRARIARQPGVATRASRRGRPRAHRLQPTAQRAVVHRCTRQHRCDRGGRGSRRRAGECATIGSTYFRGPATPAARSSNSTVVTRPRTPLSDRLIARPWRSTEMSVPHGVWLATWETNG